MSKISIERLRSICAKHGFNLHTLVPPKLTSQSEAEKMVNKWCDQGFHAELTYLSRTRERSGASKLLETAFRSILVLGVRYGVTSHGPLELPQDFGRVARFAWGQDYHRVLRTRVAKLLESIASESGASFKHKICCDATSLYEKPLAAAAGLGFIGKNSLLIVPTLGSYLFLAEVLWDLDVLGYQATVSPSCSCGTCRRCVDACRSEALSSARYLDARRCVAYLTVEKKGSFSWQEREWLGEWIFGCDICQEACPYNADSSQAGDADFPEFRASAGVGPFLDLRRILEIQDRRGFEALFSGTALMRCGRERLLRNAAVVAGNSGSPSLLDILLSKAQQDPSALVREHAFWALCKLKSKCDNRDVARIKEALAQGVSDPDERVAGEVAALMESEWI
ncbi:MAG: tRNA epoxyqueuosine(34) reductase QueG [Deltaproteobacteria bacterium]|nr:tRNA epoxyqueuosine(34) reductase QueG [Deltaproteobacteria bacterium]